MFIVCFLAWSLRDSTVIVLLTLIAYLCLVFNSVVIVILCCVMFSFGVWIFAYYLQLVGFVSALILGLLLV